MRWKKTAIGLVNSGLAVLAILSAAFDHYRSTFIVPVKPAPARVVTSVDVPQEYLTLENMVRLLEQATEDAKNDLVREGMNPTTHISREMADSLAEEAMPYVAQVLNLDEVVAPSLHFKRKGEKDLYEKINDSVETALGLVEKSGDVLGDISVAIIGPDVVSAAADIWRGSTGLSEPSLVRFNPLTRRADSIADLNILSYVDNTSKYIPPNSVYICEGNQVVGPFLSNYVHESVHAQLLSLDAAPMVLELRGFFDLDARSLVNETYTEVASLEALADMALDGNDIARYQLLDNVRSGLKSKLDRIGSRDTTDRITVYSINPAMRAFEAVRGEREEYLGLPLEGIASLLKREIARQVDLERVVAALKRMGDYCEHKEVYCAGPGLTATARSDGPAVIEARYLTGVEDPGLRPQTDGELDYLLARARVSWLPVVFYLRGVSETYVTLRDSNGYAVSVEAAPTEGSFMVSKAGELIKFAEPVGE